MVWAHAILTPKWICAEGCLGAFSFFLTGTIVNLHRSTLSKVMRISHQKIGTNVCNLG